MIEIWLENYIVNIFTNLSISYKRKGIWKRGQNPKFTCPFLYVEHAACHMSTIVTYKYTCKTLNPKQVVVFKWSTTTIIICTYIYTKWSKQPCSLTKRSLLIHVSIYTPHIPCISYRFIKSPISINSLLLILASFQTNPSFSLSF